MTLRIYLIIGAAILALGLVWKIQDYGYERCETKHKNAEQTHNETSQKAIVDLGVGYDEIESMFTDNTDSVGANVTSAIDRLPDHSNR